MRRIISSNLIRDFRLTSVSLSPLSVKLPSRFSPLVNLSLTFPTHSPRFRAEPEQTENDSEKYHAGKTVDLYLAGVSRSVHTRTRTRMNDTGNWVTRVLDHRIGIWRRVF
jgi:hypothetical protein